MIGTLLSRNFQERDVLSCFLHDSSCNFAICKIAVSRGMYLKTKSGVVRGGGSGTTLRSMFVVCSTLIAGDEWWRGTKRIF